MYLTKAVVAERLASPDIGAFERKYLEKHNSQGLRAISVSLGHEGERALAAGRREQVFESLLDLEEGPKASFRKPAFGESCGRNCTCVEKSAGAFWLLDLAYGAGSCQE